ncbi:MAG: (2Fe-2S)-binding protein [Spirochaetota bacterium]|nr:(2Fe-2S)-binding protein [Spirochaetota bacterium]
MKNTSITVNGSRYDLNENQLRIKLIDYLREELGLTGVKNGCGTGVCGACTVLVDGMPRRSCMTAVDSVKGKEILTIEGLENSDGTLHPVQQAFLDAGAVQCGFCTPGMVLTALAFLRKNPDPSREQIRLAMNANLCRCTGYQQIVDAVELAANRMHTKKDMLRNVAE